MKILIKLLMTIGVLVLVACATGGSNVAVTKPGAKLDRASFRSYGLGVEFSEASQVKCDYGGGWLADFKRVPDGKKSWGGSSHIYQVVYTNLECAWISQDGTSRKESVQMDKLLLPRIVEWEHFDGEELVEDEPLQLGGVDFTILINDKQFTIVRDYSVQLYGERLPENARRVKAVEVKQVIYERK